VAPAEIDRLNRALTGRYRVDREIGRGGWGTVYLAADLRHDRQVAIKVARLDTGAPGARERFIREISLEARFAHPHIVPLFEADDADGTPFFVMPYIAGESLQHRIARGGPLAIADAVRIARQVADALAHAHHEGVVHRDIKPGNILLAGDNAMVADFGVASARTATLVAQGDHSISSAGVQVGTPAYMAPEQAVSDPSMDGRADLYSLGCVLYEMLVGRPPFEATTPAGVLARHAMDPVPPIRTVRPSVPAALVEVLDRLLAKAPQDRFAEAAAARDALDRALDAGAARRVPVPRWRRVGVPAAVAAVIVALGTLVVRGTAEDRALAALQDRADSTRIAIFPFEGSSAIPGADDALRRAVARWEGIALVDAFAIREASNGRELSPGRRRALALRLGATRYLLGAISPGDGASEMRLVLYDAAAPLQPLAEVTERVPDLAGARDAALARLVERVLVRQPLPAGVSATEAGSSVLPARQAYLLGRAAVLRWELDSAEVLFENATTRDPRYVAAALWLALVRFWKDAPASEWRMAAQAAQAAEPPGTEASLSVADALIATADDPPPVACSLWRRLAERAPFDFVGWYSSALCLDRDKALVLDREEPSGWRFRSSYHTALQHYLRAFQLLPPIHRSLRDDAFQRMRYLLVVAHGHLRQGRTPDGTPQLAAPSLRGDTLVFVPLPASAVYAADLPVARATADAAGRVVARQRRLFRDLATTWVTTDPSSATAYEALALSLQLLGDPGAIDTIAKAARIASTPRERRRVATTEVWIRVSAALPDDAGQLAAARMIADSALRRAALDEEPRSMRAIAALTGQVGEAARRSADGAATAFPRGIAVPATNLLTWAAFGGPAESVAAAERALVAAADRLEAFEDLAVLTNDVFPRAARSAWPASPAPLARARASTGDYLLPLIGAIDAADSVAVAKRLRELRALRDVVPPSRVAFDALLTESNALVRSGHHAEAVRWLDEGFAALRTSVPAFDPVVMAAIPRAMALRAELAGQQGDRGAARRWARAVIALWSPPDPPLAPLVQRMHALARLSPP
jgi:hypothetical protein